jgi:uncharacterized protein (DUF4415 family)
MSTARRRRSSTREDRVRGPWAVRGTTRPAGTGPYRPASRRTGTQGDTQRVAIQRSDEDAPEATNEWFDDARAAKDVLPGLVGIDAAEELLKPKRGRPRSANPKEHVNIRLNDALQDWLSTHPPAR